LGTCLGRKKDAKKAGYADGTMKIRVTGQRAAIVYGGEWVE
jgi:hypothetical protein